MNTPFDHKGIDKELEVVIENSPNSISMTSDERQRLVGAFSWLIQEDKKQNPEIYQQVCDTE